MIQNERYNGTELCNGNKRCIIRYIWMLFMLLMVKKTVSKSCSESHVCLTWKIQNSSLVLICKVDTKNNYPITFYDPFHNETGFCVHVKCQSLLPNAVIKTRDKTNNVMTLQEIVFIIPMKVQLNGWWTCTHGHNNSEAVAEVTIQDILSNRDSGNRNDIECWCLMMLWSLFGFGCSWLVVRLIEIFVTCHQNKEQKKEYAALAIKDPDEWKEFIEHLSRKERTPAWKNVIVFFLSSILFLLPLIVGLIGVELCKVARGFSIYGAIVGIIIFSLLMNKGKTKNTVKNSKYSSNGQIEEIEMDFYE